MTDKRIRIESTVTYRCNARCTWCNKAVGYAKFPNTEMTPEQMRRAVDQTHEQDIAVDRITLSGGEPCVHSQLQEIIDEAARFKGRRWGRVLTNGLNSTKARRDAIRLPRRFQWIEQPLDDLDDPMSGKNDPSKRPESAYMNKLTGGGMKHTPFFISPADIGLEATWEQCEVRGWCGKGLDSSGWSMCGKAGMFGRLFGIDPHMQEGDIYEHVNTPIPDICKHCQYGLPKKQQYQITRDYEDGKFDFDISPTFQEAFAKHKESPVEFTRMPEGVDGFVDVSHLGTPKEAVT